MKGYLFRPLLMAEETIMALTELGVGTEDKLLDEFDGMRSSGLGPFVIAAPPRYIHAQCLGERA